MVTASEIVGHAAFADGKYALASPSFGSERMGAPVQSFVKISDKPIRARNQIQNPDYLIIQDRTLIGMIDVAKGLKPGGLVIVDSELKPDELGLKVDGTIYTVPATKIALETIGRPVQNTTLLGYFAAVSGLISFDGVRKAIEERFPGIIGQKNVKAAEKAFNMAKEAVNV